MSVCPLQVSQLYHIWKNTFPIESLKVRGQPRPPRVPYWVFPYQSQPIIKGRGHGEWYHVYLTLILFPPICAPSMCLLAETALSKS